MRYKLLLVLLFAVALFAAISVLRPIGEAGLKSQTEFEAQQKVAAYFCPEDDCSGKLIAEIDNAKIYVHIAIYSFTHKDIADALVSARLRGVEVKVLFDKQQAAGDFSVDETLVAAGIEVKYDTLSGYMHDKFTVIDDKIATTGSFNYTQNADTRNAENLVIMNAEDVATKFELEFQKLWEKSNGS